MAEGWHKLLQWLEEECEVCLLSCCSCGTVNGGGAMICCNVCYVWDHNRSVICSTGCGCINALNEIFHGAAVFLMEESCGGSPGQNVYLICLLVGIFVHCKVSHHGISVKVQTVCCECKGTQWLVGCRITAYAPCMLTQVLPLVVEQL